MPPGTEPARRRAGDFAISGADRVRRRARRKCLVAHQSLPCELGLIVSSVSTSAAACLGIAGGMLDAGQWIEQQYAGMSLRWFSTLNLVTSLLQVCGDSIGEFLV